MEGSSTTYMFNDATILPPVSIHNLTKRILVVQPRHLALKLGAEHGDGLAPPDGAENIECILRAVLSRRVVVLQIAKLAKSDVQPPGSRFRRRTMYSGKMYSNAL